MMVCLSGVRGNGGGYNETRGSYRPGGNVDACKGCMCMSVHPLDFDEILDIFKDKNVRFSYYTLSLAVEAIMTS